MLLTEMNGVWQRTVDPTDLPVTINELKEDLGIIDDTLIDSQLTRLLWEATDRVENDARRLLMPQTWQLHLDCFPGSEFVLWRVPVRAVSFIKYYTGGVLTTLSSAYYQTDLISEPCRIALNTGYSWPVSDVNKVNAVRVEFTAGYASASAVPRNARAAVLYAAKQAYYGCEIGDNYWCLINRIKPWGFMS